VIYLNVKQLSGYAMLLFVATYSIVLPVWSLFGITPGSSPAVPEATRRKMTVKTDKLLKQSLTRPVHESFSKQTTISQAASPASSAAAHQFKAAVNAPKSASKPVKMSSASRVSPVSNYQYRMLARIISAEAKGEPLKGQVAVGAVILNRVKSKKFPDNIASNVLKRGQFEPVTNGHIWNEPTSSAYKAARLALQGWDPTYGALYFFNPVKSSSRWIWSRPVIMRIGDHVFAG
jgi:spore germination cell wall hydrolase CwlJ-like protein